jgi:hypothetical protein
MNKELINNLRIEAGIARTADDRGLIVVSPEGKIVEPLVGLEYFAELVLIECYDALIELKNTSDEQDKNGIIDSICAIKKKFGIV